PTSYTWDFGDGSPAQVVNAAPWLPTAHTYAPGTYTATLTVADGATCPPQSWPKTITIAAVTASFTYTPTPTVCVNGPFTLTSTSTVNPDPPGTSYISSYTWQINGLPAARGPHDYTTSLPTPGVYNVVLIDTDQNNCPHFSPPQTIQVTGPTPKFAVLPNGGGCVNSPVIFTDQSTPWPGPPPNTIVKWAWDFADGNTQESITAPMSHSYTDTGTYKVILT